MEKKDKEKVLNSYKRGLELVNFNKIKLLKEDTTFRYKTYEYHVKAGTYVIDDTDENIAKFLYINRLIDKLVQEKELTIKEVYYCANGTVREKERNNE